MPDKDIPINTPHDELAKEAADWDSGKLSPAEFQDAPEAIPNQSKIERMTDDELKDFVIDFLSNRYFTDRHLRSKSFDELAMIFMPIGLGGLGSYSDEELDNIGLIYEEYAKAGERSVNGYPMFLSMKIMHIEDWKRVMPVIAEKMKQRDDIVIPPAKDLEQQKNDEEISRLDEKEQEKD